jgi:glycopeptide antibiotics resistance protein
VHQSRRWSQPTLWLIVTLAYVFFLCLLSWWPLEVVEQGPIVRGRLNGFLRVPFGRVYRDTSLGAFSWLVRNLLLYGLLGVLVARTIQTATHSAATRRIGLALAGALAITFGVSVELGQAAFLPHIPDVTDAILHSIGLLLGMGLTIQLVSDNYHRNQDPVTRM